MQILSKSLTITFRPLLSLNLLKSFSAITISALLSLHSDSALASKARASSVNLVGGEKKDWVDFSHAQGAFKVKLPAKPEFMSKEITEPLAPGMQPYSMNIYYAADEINNTVYIVRYNDFPTGSYLADKSKVYDEIRKDLEAKGEILYGPEVIKKDGFEGREIRVMFEKKYTICQIYLRGNRIYMLMKQNIEEDIRISLPDDFFNSFSFLPYQPHKFESTVVEELGIKLKLPVKPTLLRDTTKDHSLFIKSAVSLNATNSNSGGIYMAEVSEFKKYYRAENADTLLNFFQKGFIGSDSIIKTEQGVRNGIRTRNFAVYDSTSGNTKRTRLLTQNGRFYVLVFIGSQEEAFGPIADNFFNSFVINEKKAPSDLYSSKAKLLTEDLLASDTTIFNEAKGALSYYKFDKLELPFLYSALKKRYRDDNEDEGVRVKLIETLMDVNDEETGPKLEQLYQEPETQDIIRETILYILPQVDKKNGYPAYLKLLTQASMQSKYVSRVAFRPLYDSLGFAAAHFDALASLVHKDNYRYRMIDLIEYLVFGEDSTGVETGKKSFSSLSSYAMGDLKNYLTNSKNLQDSSYNYSAIYSYLLLMQECKDRKLTASFTDELISKTNDESLKTCALVTRIRNNLELDKTLLRKNLDSLYSRFDVLKAFALENQLDKVDQLYRKQDEFAKACLYKYLVDIEDYLPESLELLGSQTEKDSIYYVFNIGFTEDEKPVNYLGVAGPYKPADASLNFDKYNAFTLWEEKKDDWKEQALEHIKKLQEQ